MSKQEAVLEQQEDASASSEEYVDTSIDSSIDTDEVETKPEEVAEEQESEDDSSTSVENNDDEKTDGSFQERVDKLTKNWRESERALTALEQENVDLRKKLSEIPTSKEPLKSLADFEYDNEKYMSYMTTEIETRAIAAAEKAGQGFQDQAVIKQSESDFSAREAEFAKTVKDYQEVAYERSLKVSAPMAAAMRASEAGPEIAYYLGKNPDVARRIFSLPAETAGLEIGLIQADLAAKKVEAKPKKVSNAPPPPPKIKAGDPGITKDTGDMSDREFAKWRRKQIANR